uniref:RNA-dependent RNA polymerase n=1 Tax=Crocidura shantungensis ribovirus 3 TaxID=3139538 RepID=A0AB38ZK18_9VIRU
MRWRDAFRIAHYRHYKGYDRFNCAIIINSCLVEKSFDKFTKKFVLKYNLFGRLKTASHRNPYHLLKITSFQISSVTYLVQGSIMAERGDMELGLFLKQSIPKQITLKDTIKKDPCRLKPIAAPNLPLEILTDEERAQVDQWGHSSQIVDAELRSRAITMFVKEKEQLDDEDYDEELWLQFVSMVVLSDDEIRDVPPVTKDDLLSVPINKNSSGLLALDPCDGIVHGTKEGMIDVAADLAMDARPVLIPHTLSPKWEALKKGKKLRYIVLQEFRLFLLSFYFFGDMVKKHGRVVNSDAVGLSLMNGDMLKPWLNMIMGIMNHDECEFEEALNKLEEIGCNESDKSQWEYELLNHCMEAYTLYLASTRTPAPPDLKRFCNVLAHQLCPYIQFADNQAFPALGKVTSGSFFTTKGNTKIHGAGVQSAVLTIQKHNGIMGDENCGCFVCRGLPSRVVFTERDIYLVCLCVITGDDYLGPNIHSEIFNKIIDLKLGSITKTEVLPAFGEPGVECAKFLQHSVRKEGNRLTSFRETGRILGKLYNGDARLDPASLIEALHSAALEAGDNPRVNDLMHQLYDWVIDSKDFEEFSDALIEAGESYMPVPPPSLNTVVNLQNELNRAAFDLAADRLV